MDDFNKFEIQFIGQGLKIFYVLLFHLNQPNKWLLPGLFFQDRIKIDENKMFLGRLDQQLSVDSQEED